MIQLKLDTNAINSLFPEGTEARLNLQAAVIKNIVDSVVGKKVTEEIDNCIVTHVSAMMPPKHEIEKIVQNQFADYIQKRYTYSNVFDANYSGIRQIKDVITENVKQQCANLIESIKLDAIDSASKNLKEDEEAFIARVTKNLEVTVRKEIIARVNTQFPQIIDEAIKARLFPEDKG